MQGEHRKQETVYSYVAPEVRVPEPHLPRAVPAVVNVALVGLDAEFEALYSDTRRPSSQPGYPMRATLLQILYSVRSVLRLVEQVDYSLLFRSFIGLLMDGLVGLRHLHQKPGPATRSGHRPGFLP